MPPSRRAESRRNTRLGAALTLAVGVVVALSGSGPFAQTAERDGPSREWMRVRSENFLAVGNAREADLREALRELEAFRSSLSSFGLPHLTPATLATIIVFEDDAAFGPFRPRDETGRLRQTAVGYFTGDEDVKYLVLSAKPIGDRDLMLRVTLHEYAHDVLTTNVPKIPLWLNEGLAEFYASISLDRARGRSTIGTALRERVQVLDARRLLPVEDMINPVQAMDYVSSERTSAMFYAESWALVHYLFIGSPERTGQLQRYLEAIERGLSSENAFAEVFGPPDVLQRELERYVQRGRFDDRQLPPAAQSPDAESQSIEAMLESEVAALEGDLLVRVRAFSEGERRLQRALSLAPSSTTARLAMALLRIEQSRFDEAIALLRPLVAERPDWRAGHLHLSSALRRAGQLEEAFVEYERGQRSEVKGQR